MKIIQSKKYRQAAAKLVDSDERFKKKLLEIYEIMERDIFNPQLKTHKLKGGFAGLWSSSVTYSIRIVFEFTEEKGEKVIELLAIGSHDAVY